MIILNRVSDKLYLYPIGKAKGALNSHRKAEFIGIFSIDREDFSVTDFIIQKDNHTYTLSALKLEELLNKQNIYLAGNDEITGSFLDKRRIKYKHITICGRCLKKDIITVLNDKSKIDFNSGFICEDCLDEDIKFYLKHKGYNQSSYKIFKRLYHKTGDINEIYDLIDNNYNPVENEKLSLYDTLEMDEDNYEKVSVDKIDLPGEFKNILNDKIDYLLPVQILSLKEDLLEGKNQLVVSATASGKTLIAELAGIPKAMNNKKFIYLSPQVSLANQKYRNFKKRYENIGLKVAIRVGSNRIKAKEEITIEDDNIEDSDIIVATYESLDFILRNKEADTLKNVGTLVIDEIHMLENRERGSRLNGLIKRFITLFPDTQIIGLSATIKNPEELAEEFKMQLVEYKNRPVSIERHLIYTQNNEEKKKIITNLCKKEYERISTKGYKGQTIIFTDSRRKTQEIVKQLKKLGINASSYHAGLTYSKKIDIEIRYMKQEISTVVTTAALAAGVDFPASQVIFESLRMGKDWLTSNEFHQMMGRAGRPRYHDIGRVYLIPTLNKSYDGQTEETVATHLLESSVDEINVNFRTEDVYEQVLSDITAIKEYDIDKLEEKYETYNIPIKFSQAIDKLYNCEMIEYNPQENYYETTEYGQATSVSFLKIEEAEYIKNHLLDDIPDIITTLMPISNIYLSSKLINSFKRITHHNISIRLLSDSNRQMITNGYIINKLPRQQETMMIDLQIEYMNCQCKNRPYCTCLEKNISKHILRRRLDGWDPLDISNEFRKNYEINIYSGDIYSWLDQVIRYLEAIMRIGKSYDNYKIKRDCEDLIIKIENK